MKLFLKTFLAWVRLRPGLALNLAFFAGLGTGIAGMLESDAFIWLWLLAVGIVFALAVARDWKKDLTKFTALTLAAALVTTGIAPVALGQEKKEPIQPAGPVVIGVGLGLLIGYGYVMYRIVRCQAEKHKHPKPTNAEPEGVVMQLDDAGTAAGIICWGGYCWEPVSVEQPGQNTFIMDVQVDVDEFGLPTATLSNAAHVPESQMVSYDEWNADLAAWGVTWTGQAGTSSYAVNGRPVTADQVPFTFTQTGVILYPAREQFRVRVEVTHQLNTYWEPVLQTSLPAGVKVQVVDTPPGEQSFYRARVD